MRVALLTAAAVGTSLLLAQEKPPGVPTFPSAVDLITVDAVVVDKDGRAVSGLTRDDFVVSEDGRPQEIATFEAIDRRRDDVASAPDVDRAKARPPQTQTTGAPVTTFVLLVDDVGMPPARQADVRRIVERFLATGVRDGDELVFATTGGTWWSARLPEGRQDVLALAHRVRGLNLLDNTNDAISEWEAYRITHVEGLVVPDEAVAGSSIIERVHQRYLAQGVCQRPPLEPSEFCYAKIRRKADEVDARRANHTRDVFAAVDRAVFALSGVRGRKALLLLSEGFLNDPDLPGAREVAGRCREANLAVYSLDVRGLMTGLPGGDSRIAPNAQELGLMQLETVEFSAAGAVELAEETGGFAIHDTNDLGGGALRSGEESRVYYLIGYTPPPGKGPRDWRKLKVEVKRPGLTVRARKGYTLRTSVEILAADEARSAAASRAGASADRPGSTGRLAPLPVAVARALASPRQVDDIPVRARAYVFGPRPRGLSRTVVTVEVNTSAIANLGGEERARAVLSLSIAATHRDSGETAHVDQRVQVEGGETAAWQGWLAVNREFELAPGVVQARVVVRDEFLGRVGADTTRFVVPPASGLAISTPILTPRTWRPREGGPPQPVLVARREFEPAGPLYCYFEVFGAGRGPVQTMVELRRRGGEVVRQDPRRPIEPTLDGRLVRFFNFPLDGLAPGDYELRIQIENESTEEKQERLEPLRLAGTVPPSR